MWPFIRKSKRFNPLENPATPLTAAALIEYGGADGAPNESAALSIPAVWAAVDFISSTLAALPLKVYRQKDGDREEQRGPYWRMLNRAPNAGQTAYDWRKYFWERVLLYGRCYSVITRRAGGTPFEIWTPDPGCMEVERLDGKLIYRLYETRDKKAAQAGLGKKYDAEDIIDVPWMLSSDGVTHYSPLGKMWKVLAQGIGAIEYGRRFFANGGMAHFVLTGPLTTQGGLIKAQADMESALRKMGQTGGQVLSLPVDHDLKQISANPDQSQMVSVQQFTVEQVARIYGVPPTMLQDWRKSTYSNMEHADTAVVKHTLSKWAVRLQQQLNLKFFGPASERMFVEHSMAGIMRGDLKARAEAMARQIQTGQLTPNEARQLDNREPLAGGDDLLIQGATVPLKNQDAKMKEPAPMPAPPDDNQPEGGGDDDA